MGQDALSEVMEREFRLSVVPFACVGFYTWTKRGSDDGVCGCIWAAAGDVTALLHTYLLRVLYFVN